MLHLELPCSAANKHHDAEESTFWQLSECHISSTFCLELPITSTIKTLRSVPSKTSFQEVFSEERNAYLLELFHIYTLEEAMRHCSACMFVHVDIHTVKRFLF